MTDPTFYQRRIAERTRNVDPRHVEAWMRLEHPTLDGLSAAEFEREIEEGARVHPSCRHHRVRDAGRLVRPVAGRHR